MNWMSTAWPMVTTMTSLNDPRTPERVRFGSDNTGKYAGFNPEKIIGRSYSCLPRRMEQLIEARLWTIRRSMRGSWKRTLSGIKFKVEVGDQKFEEYVAWNEICNFIEEQSQNEKACSGGRLADHQVLIKWESGERTGEPISEIYRSTPHELANYAMQHDLIDKWECRSIRSRH